MKPTDEEMARLREAFASHTGPAPDPESCPAPEAILAAVRGELPQKEIRAIVEHTAICPTCAEEWRLAVAFEEEAGEPAARHADLRSATAERPWLHRLSRYAAAAAAVLLLAVVLPKLWTPDKPARRGSGRGEIRQLSAETLPRQNCLLRWTERPDATYRVEVFYPDGDMIATGEGGHTPEYRVPASKLRDVPTGTRLEWQVTASFPPGHRPSSKTSATFSFILQ